MDGLWAGLGEHGGPEADDVCHVHGPLVQEKALRHVHDVMRPDRPDEDMSELEEGNMEMSADETEDQDMNDMEGEDDEDDDDEEESFDEDEDDEDYE